MPKILFVNTYYEAFLKDNPLEPKVSYEENLQKRVLSRFGDSDFYSYWIGRAGWQSKDVIANDLFLQEQWALENKYQNISSHLIWQSQLKEFKPDIVYFQDISMLNQEIVNFLRAQKITICAQHASPLPESFSFQYVDVFISSMPHLIDLALANGTKAHYLPLAFDHRILEQVSPRSWDKRVLGGFAGGYSPAHTKGVEIVMSALAYEPRMCLYGYDWNKAQLQLRSNNIVWSGPIWGLEMFGLLGSWKISLNRHIDMSGIHANNMRIYESTGMGAVLLTDKKQKNNLFESGIEMVEYEGLADLQEKITYLVTHDQEMQAIAKAGQEKTLKNHTYEKRMQELSIYLKSI